MQQKPAKVEGVKGTEYSYEYIGGAQYLGGPQKTELRSGVLNELSGGWDVIFARKGLKEPPHNRFLL